MQEGNYKFPFQHHHDEVNVVRKLFVCHTTVMSEHLGWNAKWGGGSENQKSKWKIQNVKWGGGQKIKNQNANAKWTWGGGQNSKLSKYLVPWCCWALIAIICKFVNNLDNFVLGMNTRWLHWLRLGKMETQHQHNKSLSPLTAASWI